MREQERREEMQRQDDMFASCQLADSLKNQ